MLKQQRRTVRYRGVKVRYTHRYIFENGFAYTTTEIDEGNMDRVLKAYVKYVVKQAKMIMRKRHPRKNRVDMVLKAYDFIMSSSFNLIKQ